MVTKQEQYWGKIILVGTLILFPFYNMYNNTLSYNMRIRRALLAAGDNWQENQRLESLMKLHWTITALPIVYYRTRDIITQTPKISVSEQSSIKGALFNIRFHPNKRWWIELTSGLEKEVACFTGSQNICVSRTGFDDMVISSGINFFTSPSTQFTLYGLAGFPTKMSISAQEVFDTPVGTRFYNLGIGGEASYAFINSFEKSLISIVQARFIHFFNREWFPILPITNQIQPGNITDALVTLQYRKKMDIFEVGFNATFFTNQGVVSPINTIKTNNFHRSSLYATYKHIVLAPSLTHNPLIIGCGANLSWSKQFNTQIGIAWLSLTTVF